MLLLLLYIGNPSTLQAAVLLWTFAAIAFSSSGAKTEVGAGLNLNFCKG